MAQFLENPTARFLIFVVCAALFVICDTLAAHWGKNDSKLALISVILLAPFSYIAFGYLNKNFPLAIVSSWVTLALCTATVLIGIFVFGDQLSVRQGIGVCLAIVAVGFLVS